MKKQDFYYALPQELIAQSPSESRSDSRLLHLKGQDGSVSDCTFSQLLDLLKPGDLVVFNDTRVIPARLYAKKISGGQVEILVERLLSSNQVLAHVRASKSPKPGAILVLQDDTRVEVVGRRDALFELRFPPAVDPLKVMESIGHMPLPPYIDRTDREQDKERYQTVYGCKPGAVAAPTAGLHFDDDILASMAEKGVKTAFVTLHVGAGTFQPVRSEDIREHAMHSEVMCLDQQVCDLVTQTKADGGRVIAVGTTSVRCLETAASAEGIHPYQGETNIFIYPGYEFKVVDCLVTNFHLPESTLLMLVSAFAGYAHTMAAYQHAVVQRYRFFSYGDAMFIEKNTQAPAEFNPRIGE